MRPVACLITDRTRLGPDAGNGLVRRAVLAGRAGVHLIQIRERDMTDRDLVALVVRTVDALRGTRARVLVNDRVDVAMAAGAHGVHLRADSAPADRVRRVVPSGFLIGRSVHSGAEAETVARTGGVDYLLFGTVFETTSKPGRTLAGLAGLTEAVRAAPSIPVLAVGGVTALTVGQLQTTGCAGFAAIGLFADPPEASLSSIVERVLVPWKDGV